MSFSRYPEYKNSGIDWLGEVPKHWLLTALKHMATLNPRKSDFNGDRKLSCSFVPMEKLKTGKITLDERRAIGDVIDGYTYFENGDVLQAKVTPCFENKNVAIAQSLVNGVGFGSSEIDVLRPSSETDSAYLFYRVQEDGYMAICTASMIGAGGLKRVPSDVKNNFKVAIPPSEEQTQIARFLDHETAKIDTLIHEQKRLIELLKEKRQALVLSAFSLSDSVETRLANAVNLIYKPVSQKVDETYIPIGLFNRGRGLFHKDPRGIEEMGESDFFWVNDGDLIISGQFAWEGAVALAGEKEQGKVVSHRYPILRGKNGIVTTEYIFALLTTRHGDFLLNENSRGAAGRNKPLNISALLKEKITIPAFSLQNKIVEIVHQERQIKAEASRQKKLLLEHRAALISAAVTGKIDVRGWQPPAYESAFDEEIRQAEIKVTA